MLKTEFIPKENLQEGLHLAMDYAKHFLEISKKFHDENEFQLSIPCAILAFEESSKADHLDDNMQKGKGLTDIEWKEIRTHEYKLIDAEKRIKKKIEHESDLSMYVQGAILSAIGLSGIKDRKTAITVKEKQIEIYSKFSAIKEACFYSNWNKTQKKWQSFMKIPPHEKKALSLYIVVLAEHKFLLTKLGIEVHENPFRKITDNELFSSQKRKEYFKSRLEHHQKMETVKEMQEFEKRTEGLVKELRKGLSISNKYFSN